MATTATTTTTSDSIHKQITLRATPARVWRALSDAREFSAWFGAEMRGEFVPGQLARGAVAFKGQELAMELLIERLEPERLMAFRWHPFAIDPSVDYSHEPMTLVEIRLEPAPEGTRLTITESGFDQIPAARRAQAFEMNTGGWNQQAENIARHVHA
jgi:uncharacterized protein YndB with AHSA1/START domain